MSSVIVTGASGFIGAALVGMLRRSGYVVTAIDRSNGDVADHETWSLLEPADHVVHLAGRTYVPDSWRAPVDFYATNVVGAARATEYCRKNRAHLVLVSGYVYGIPQNLPINEDHPINPNNPYALSKSLAEKICAFHAENEKLPVTIVRPFNIFGPGQRRAFLIPMIIDQINAGIEIRVKDLVPRRDYLFVDDLNEGIARTLHAPAGLRAFNFGFGQSYSVREIIDMAQSAAASTLPVICDRQQRTNEILDVVADIRHARQELGWEPHHTMLDGLLSTLKANRGSAQLDRKEVAP